MRRFLLVLLFLLVPTAVGAQGSTKAVPPACTVANIATCVPQVEGTIVRVIDGNDASDCETTGGGSTVNICQYNGTLWGSMALVSATTGVWVGENGETISNGTDNEFTFTTGTTGVVKLQAMDAAGAAQMIIAPATSGYLELGTTTATEVRALTTDIAFHVSETADTVTIENISTGSVVLDFRDYGDTTSDDMAHGSIAVNCTNTGAGTEVCDMQINATEAGNGVVRLLIDGDLNNTFNPEPTDGGNGDLQHRIVGIPKIAGFSLGTGNDGSETTNVDFGDSETPNTDWTQTANITTSDDSATFRKGSASLKMVIGTTPSAGNGADNALGTGDQNWSADESFGLWVRCDTTFSAGDWVLGITDNASEDVTTGFLAYGTANTWVWQELEIGSIADADKDVITDLAIDLSSAGATTFVAGGNCFFDYLWKWDAAEELAVGADVYEDGFLSMFSVITASAAITPILEVEGTDWFAHYEAGNDFVVPITDLSNDSLWGTVALE